MKIRNSSRHRERGAALVIGLILLMIITLLAVVGMNISNSELASATSEQLRLRAFAAAETGIERGMENLGLAGTGASVPVALPVTDLVGSPVNPSTGTPQDRYQVTVQYRGFGSFTPGNSPTKFETNFFTVVSTGTSARNAVAVHTAGAYIISGKAF
jgi:type II secretory pathway component PulK